MSLLLRPVALLLVLAAGVLVGVSFAPDGPDTGPDVAARLHPGMTMNEAVGVIGAPPGDYRLAADQTPFYFGFYRGIARYRWAGYRGYINVAGGPPPGRTGYRDPADYSDRVVWSVEWAPVEQHPKWWRLLSPVAVAAAVAASVLLVVRVVGGRASRRAGAVQPSWPSPA